MNMSPSNIFKKIVCLRETSSKLIQTILGATGMKWLTLMVVVMTNLANTK